MINKLVRVLGLGLMIATFAFAGFAQERTRAIVYEQYTANFESKDPAKIQLAVDAAKEYVSKFNTPDDKAQVDYFNSAIPTLEKSIADLKQAAADGDAIKKETADWYAQLKKVVDAANAKNWAETFAQGKIAIDTQFKYLDKPNALKTEAVKGQKLDIAIALGTIGFDRALEKTETFNDQAVTYLKSSIQQLESGQTGTTTFGKAVGYDLQSKDNALGLLNYYAGFILNYRQKKVDESLGYFYKASQFNSPAKNYAVIYEAIGAKFYDKIAQMDPKRLALIEAAPDKKDTPETIAMLAEERGNAERGIEAYSKALKAAQADPKASQKYKDDLRTTLEQLYKFRFDNKTDGLDTYISAAAGKPLTNPTEPVKPIVVEEPATTETTPASTTTTTTTPATTPGAKPATTTTTKPAATTTTPASTTTKPAATTTTTNANPAATTATKPAATTATKPAATATKPAATTPKATTPKKPRKR